MSKSLGNFFTIREVTKLYHPLALRHFLLGTHYRSPVNYSISQIEISSEAVFYIYQTLQDCEDAVSSLKEESATNAKVRISPAAQECISKLHNEFEAKLADDLHTPSILNAALQEALRFINSSVNMLKKKQQKQQQLSPVKSLVDLEKQVREVMDVLGLLPSLSYSEVLQQLKDKALRRAGLTEAEISHAIEERMQARKNKEFSRSDQIRSDLAAKGIALMDVGKETVWRPCVPVQQEQPSTPAQQEKRGVPGEEQNPPQPAEKPQSVVPADK
ncbi:Cysteine--tRNA ligase CPS1, chloroplastic/mitochondrial [Sesamum alatum]|uniref:Cysteine--tRNA ligase CPS1, chloroplastic/mitochondrial n=1 Tax=Sesamum alatum TaxID=300844 RepID=A0AAE1XSK8_9LAMI|nr:Cysteine--tRNA ligase CPS1, chloroplastic/mitochondrial [Sesamum alatum]